VSTIEHILPLASPKTWTRLGLILDVLGGCMLALEIIGSERIEKLEARVKTVVTTLANPVRFLRAALTGNTPGAWNIFGVCLFVTFLLLWIRLPLRAGGFVRFFMHWPFFTPVDTVVMFCAAFYGAVFARLRTLPTFRYFNPIPRTQREIAAWSRVWIIMFSLACAIALSALPAGIIFVVGCLLYLMCFSAICSIVLLPLRFGYWLKTRWRFRAALPATGLLLIVAGFLFQFVGTF